MILPTRPSSGPPQALQVMGKSELSAGSGGISCLTTLYCASQLGHVKGDGGRFGMVRYIAITDWNFNNTKRACPFYNNLDKTSLFVP
jgi:hypothetical protein